MENTSLIEQLEEKIRVLETRVKHLSNDLRLTQEEKEHATSNYHELYTRMEQKVEERAHRVKRLQKALEQKGQELELMLDSSPAVIFYKDAEQRLIRVNRNFARLVGLPVAEITGKRCDELLIPSDEVSEAKDREVMETGLPLLNQIETVETPRGTRHVRIDRIPYLDMDSKVIGLIGFALDVTKLKDAEEERNKLESQLLHAQRMESIGTLAGGIAHNFNNLLMGILGHISLMLLNTESESPQHAHLKKVEQQIRSGADLTKQLLGYAMKGQFVVRTFNLNHLVRETAETFGLAKKDVALHYELDEDLASIRADSSQLEQVLMNLYVNASDAMPRGGDLYLSTCNVSHEEMADKPYRPKPGRYVALVVRDTGQGMDPETMERIFEPFFTTKGLAKGTGLGLASAYGIVTGHGGYIDVESEKGAGATFTLYLPASFEDLRDEQPIKETDQGRSTILVVDDEETVVDVAEQMLIQMGYRVLTARSGAEALDQFERHGSEVHLILLDMIMPGSGGGETYDRLRALSPDVPVLLSSGYSRDGEASEILARGCQGFIQKPFNLQDLSSKIQELLDPEGVDAV